MDLPKSSLTSSENVFIPGSLLPTTSHGSQRYDNVANVKLSHMRITSGYGTSSLEPEPSYLPPLWASHTDPEGARYFVQDSEPRLVTPTDIYVSTNAGRLQFWLKHIQALLITKNITISPALELFLRLEDDDCCYYLVDHASQKEFWLEDLETDALGLGPVVSPSHLDHLGDGRIICLVARLRQSIVTNRFWTHHGQETARCSRDQTILYDEDADHENIFVPRVFSWLTLGVSSRYSAQLEEAFTDRLVYKDVWRKMVATNLSDWKSTSLNAYLALTLHILFFLAQTPSIPSRISASMFLGSIITSTILQHRYETMKDSSADRGHDHLSSIYSTRYRFSLTSLAFALPKTLYLWGIVTVVGTCIFWLTTVLAHVFGLFAAGSVGLFLVVGIFAVHRLTSESSILPEWPFRRIALNNTDNSPV
ncbi:hypothetical protein DL96DRAFT_1708503 [Flagelloscypha sp. PMI_526]|nr:hypothetical protein DL96DRAFT_1708503 [Flagelloscypha sp. PMI_526]